MLKKDGIEILHQGVKMAESKLDNVTADQSSTSDEVQRRRAALEKIGKFTAYAAPAVLALVASKQSKALVGSFSG